MCHTLNVIFLDLLFSFNVLFLRLTYVVYIAIVHLCSLLYNIQHDLTIIYLSILLSVDIWYGFSVLLLKFIATMNILIHIFSYKFLLFSN